MELEGGSLVTAAGGHRCEFSMPISISWITLGKTIIWIWYLFQKADQTSREATEYDALLGVKRVRQRLRSIPTSKSDMPDFNVFHVYWYLENPISQSRLLHRCDWILWAVSLILNPYLEFFFRNIWKYKAFKIYFFASVDFVSMECGPFWRSIFEMRWSTVMRLQLCSTMVLLCWLSWHHCWVL